MEAVLVAVRVRPLSEQEDGSVSVLTAKNDTGCVSLVNPKAESDPPKSFTYDQVYDENTNQELVYEQAAFPLIDSVMEGFNSTIFAYGQTGAGKTYTMVGDPDDDERKGIIPRSFEHIFESIHGAGERSRFLIVISYLEIYNEEIRDLLAGDGKRLELKEDPEKGVVVKDLIRKRCGDAMEVKEHLKNGFENQVQAATAMNVESSRSHSIFCVYVEREDTADDKRVRAAKLNLVDLAGSERQVKASDQSQRGSLRESTKINLSLSALGNVISALVDGAAGKNIPFRDSKLTRLLQDSLGGNTRTVMMANVGPAGMNYDETLATLRYANRAKNIKNKPVVNDDPKDCLLRELQSEVERLRNALQQYQTEKVNAAQGGQRPGAAKSKERPRNRSKAHLSFETSNTNLSDGKHGQDGQRPSAASGSRAKGQRSTSDDSSFQQPTHAPNSQDADNDFLETTTPNSGDKSKDPTGALDDLLAEVNEDWNKRINQDSQDDTMYNDWLEEKQKCSRLEKENENMRQRLQDATDLHAEAKRRRKNELESRLAQEMGGGEDLDKQLEHLEAQFVVGGNAPETNSSKKDVWRLKLQKQREVIDQQRQALDDAEERALMVDQQYSSLQDEAVEKTQIIDKLRMKYKQSKSEIVDVQHEIEVSREELLEEIRESSKQLAIYKQIAMAVLPQREVKKIIARAQWDDMEQAWKLPNVSFKPLKVKLPSLGPPSESSSSSGTYQNFRDPTPRGGKRSHKSGQRNMEASASSSFGLLMGDPDEADPMLPGEFDADTWADRSPRPDTSRERGNSRSGRDNHPLMGGRGVKLDPLGSVRSRWAQA